MLRHFNLIVVGANGITHHGVFFVFLGQFHAYNGVWLFNSSGHTFPMSCNKPARLACFTFKAKFSSHNGAQVGNFT
jgi:hypothetical protein